MAEDILAHKDKVTWDSEPPGNPTTEDACALHVLSSFLEDGVGIFELILTVIRDEKRCLIPGSARVAAS